MSARVPIGAGRDASTKILPERLVERRLTRKTHLLLAAAWRDGLRWAREHIYALAVLGPLVLGMTYLTLLQATSYDLKLGPPALVPQILAAAAFVAGTMAVSLTRATRELYHLRRPTSFVEALPVERLSHLHFALCLRAGHTILLSLALLLIHSFPSAESIGVESILPLLVFTALVTVSEVYAAIGWVHWGHRRSVPEAFKTIAALIISALTGSLLLVLFFNRAAMPDLAAVLHLPAGPWMTAALYAAAVAIALLIYLLARASHEDWRGEDIDYAQRLDERAWPELSFERLPLRGRLSRAVRTLIARDLALVVRVFSSAVYVAAGLSLLVVLLLLALLLTGALPSAEETLGGLKDLGWMSATWLPASLAIKAACLLVVTCLASVVPVLVSHQIQHAWLERSVGATANDLWRAKLWFTRLLTLVPVLAVYLIGVAAVLLGGNTLTLSYLPPLLAEVLWLWWLASSIAGALSFEMPDRPTLALVLIFGLSLSTGMLTIILWPMGLGIYGMGVEQARERGIMQAASYLMAEE